MAIEQWLWLVSAVGAGSAAVVTLLRARRPEIGGESPSLMMLSVPAWVALASALAGLAVRAWALQAWPGAAIAEALVLAAVGALIVGQFRLVQQHPLSSGTSILLAALMLLLAVAFATSSPFESVAPQAQNWLFGIRSLLAGLGLGGWLFAITSSGWALWLERKPTDRGYSATAAGMAALRFSLPWLTLAVLAGAAWNLAAYAALWRGVPAELWLMIAWLLGASYLTVGTGESEWPGNRAVTLVVLALLGLGATLMASYQAPSLFS